MADVNIHWLTPELVRISVSRGRAESFGGGDYDPSFSAQESFRNIDEKHKILSITPVTGVGFIDTTNKRRHLTVTTAFLLLVEPRPKEKPIGIPPCP